MKERLIWTVPSGTTLQHKTMRRMTTTKVFTNSFPKSPTFWRQQYNMSSVIKVEYQPGNQRCLDLSCVGAYFINKTKVWGKAATLEYRSRLGTYKYARQTPIPITQYWVWLLKALWVMILLSNFGTSSWIHWHRLYVFGILRHAARRQWHRSNVSLSFRYTNLLRKGRYLCFVATCSEFFSFGRDCTDKYFQRMDGREHGHEYGWSCHAWTCSLRR